VQDILRLYQFVEKLVGIHMALSFYAGDHKDLVTAKHEEPLAVRWRRHMHTHMHAWQHWP
jgi:hypothetical protein